MPTRKRTPLRVSALSVRKANASTNVLTVTVCGIATKIAEWFIIRSTRISVNCFRGSLNDGFEGRFFWRVRPGVVIAKIEAVSFRSNFYADHTQNICISFV